MTRIACLTVVLLGCGGGRVKLEEEPFGNVRSAVWFDFKQDQVDQVDVELHRLVLSTQSGLCKAVGDAMQDLSNAYSTNLDFDPYDQEEACNATRAWYEDAAAITEDWYGKDGANTVSFEFYDPDAPISDPPDATTYVQGYSETEHYFFATVTLATRNPFLAVAEEIRCGDASDALESDIDEALAETTQQFFASSGTAILEEKEGKPVRTLHDFTGALVDDDGDPRGALEVDARFEQCEVSWQGSLGPLF